MTCQVGAGPGASSDQANPSPQITIARGDLQAGKMPDLQGEETLKFPVKGKSTDSVTDL